MLVHYTCFSVFYLMLRLPRPDANLADTSRLPKPEANFADVKRLPRPLANFADVKRLPSPLANLAEARRLSNSNESSVSKSSHCSSLLMNSFDSIRLSKDSFSSVVHIHIQQHSQEVLSVRNTIYLTLKFI